MEKADLEEELEKRRLELKELKLKYDKLLIEKGSNSIYINEQILKELKEDLFQKEKEYLAYKALYEEGAESKNSFEIKEREYCTAKLDYENKKIELEMEMDTKKKDIEIIKVNIEKKELEIKELERKIEKCVVFAMSDGIIKEINFKMGMVLNYTMPVYILDDISKGFELKVAMDNEQCQYIKLGDEVRVSIKNKGKSLVSGEVRAIKDNKDDIDSKIVTIELEEADLIGGEIGEFYLGKKIGSYDYLVPRSAVYQNSEGKYVFVLQEKDGPLGKDYYVIKQKVTTGDSDNNFTGIYSGLLGNEKVVIYSNKNLSNGCQVRLER
ncbi:Multidrug efflux pump subunit AcrA (membrane-fusion protein) [Paramaledivibacter caminithermalis DSM 15212]|uniref:Multidrug efflux pump subunit AcrA (Membrane-fusion protein) n=1 Tax=Paramaledivibacter caminithermalis (strain DSM 15212 / CIP 107654 / DViRD3) TaxID=1121301 RepID=A0A1M6SCY8_PARC5|nr:Multidrug efflux pump subunit AcrA (membrane-fusion protein) [Paramaledivibacter caminithermalis DSM 15212]